MQIPSDPRLAALNQMAGRANPPVLPPEAERTSQQRMYAISFGIVYEDFLGHFPFVRSFGMSDDKKAIEFAKGIMNDELVCEGVCGIHHPILVEIAWVAGEQQVYVVAEMTLPDKWVQLR